MTVRTGQWNVKMNNKTCNLEYVGSCPIIREYTGNAKEIMNEIRGRWMDNDCTKFSNEEIIDIIE